ncbi:MAG: hypothetical protein LBL18_03900 [Bacteroidales bacterium]|jgi:hypothetical protein|nr:hypothetical protein [Bacteroidales bacterium]
MKKVFLIVIAALCLVAVGCEKTCQCTVTETETYELGDGSTLMPPDVSRDDYDAKAKKCSDLNEESSDSSTFAGITTTTKTVVECK